MLAASAKASILLASSVCRADFVSSPTFSPFSEVAQGKRCEPNSWRGVQEDARACMELVQADASCNQRYFNFAADGDRNCGCITDTEKECETDLHGAAEVRLYRIYPEPTAAPTTMPTASPTPEPTPSPTDGPTLSPTLAPTPVPTTSRPTAAPTVSPTLAPSANPPESPVCEDDASFLYKGKASKNCAWVKRNPDKCSKKSNGRQVAESCPDACGQCSSACADSDDWVFSKNGKAFGCKWVAKKNEKRCKKKGTVDGATVKAKLACLAACGQCADARRRLEMIV